MKHWLLLAASLAVPTAFGATDVDRPLPVRVTFTFDDGLRDHWSIAARLLEAHGWRGTFCIVNSWIGGGRQLSWDNVRDLLVRGHEVAAHTLSHPGLKKLAVDGRLDEVRRQVAGSRDDIARRTGYVPRILCLPGSSTNADVKRIIREEGMVEMACGRCCLGENFKDIDGYLREWKERGVRRADLLTHGVTRVGGGWRPFETEADFAKMLDRVAELERAGELVVTDYAGMTSDMSLDAPAWPRHD